MTSVALCSAKGSPGVTTLACALGAVWPARRPSPVLVECDPSGADLAVRFGLSGRAGIASLLFAARDGGRQSLDAHVQALPGGLEVMVGAIGSDAAGAIDRELSQSPLARGAEWPDDRDFVFDCGRILAGAVGQHRLLARSEVVVVATGADAAALAQTRVAVRWVRSVRHGTGVPVVVAVVGPGPFEADQVSAALEPDALFGVPLDVRAARILAGGPGNARALSRSPLVGAVRAMAELLVALPTSGLVPESV